MCYGKLVILTVLLAILPNTLGTDVPPTTCVEEQVLDLFTKWRHGDTLPLPLPSLETITIQSCEGQYSGYGLKLLPRQEKKVIRRTLDHLVVDKFFLTVKETIYIRIFFTTGEMNLAGVNDFSVKELLASTDDLLEASGTVHFPLLTLTADNYNLKGRAYVFYTLKGSGLLKATFHNVTLKFGISLSSNKEDKNVQVEAIRLAYSVDAINIDLADSSWPINKVLNGQAINIIESYHDILIDMATEGVKTTLNEHLEAVTTRQILNTFLNSCDL